MLSPLERAASALAGARRACALTGAGISVESGIPDFRSPHGLWSRFRPEEYATLSVFRRNPARAWLLYRALGRSLQACRPNPAHAALASLERHGRLHGVITQNIDGLHQAAGSRLVVELHGDHRHLQCLECDWLGPLQPHHLAGGDSVPLCPKCGAALKPNMVLFEEPVRDMERALAWLQGCDLLLVIGTSAQVAPAAWLPERVRATGGSLLEFNLDSTDLDRAGLGPRGVLVTGPAGETLPGLLPLLGLPLGPATPGPGLRRRGPSDR